MKMSDKKPQHVIVYEFLPPSDGGIAQMAYEIVKELDSRGYPCALCGFHDLLAHPMYSNVSYKTFPLPRKAWKSLKDFYLFILAVKLFFHYGRNVVLYSLTWKTARLFVILKKIFGWKVVLFAIGNEITRQIGGKKEPLMRRTFLRADRISAISAYTALRCNKIGITNLHINNPGVNNSLFVPMNKQECKKHFGWEGKKIILTAGRVIARKGQDMVIRALPELCKKDNQIFYIIAGKGDPEEIARLQKISEINKVQDHVIFTGFFDDKIKPMLYNAADLYIMVSRNEQGAKDIEGFGITFLEAGGCGIPVIGSYCGGIPDAIENGVSGYTIAPDDLASLTLHISTLLSDNQTAQNIGLQACKRIKSKFTWKHYVDRMIEDFIKHEIIQKQL